jgi:hypothetical protein
MGEAPARYDLTEPSFVFPADSLEQLERMLLTFTEL